MVQRTLRFDQALRLFHRALSSPSCHRIGVTIAEADMSAGCHQPVTVEYVGRRETFLMKRHEVKPDPYNPRTWESVSVILQCKCRQCEHCLKKRRQHWWFRAKYECSIAPRTWFATFTYNPQAIFVREVEVERRCRSKGLDWDELSADERYKHLLDRCGEDMTLFFKSLRKSATAGVRYLVVSEAHKSGLPHFHALIHEVHQGAVTYDRLKRPWRWGFTAFKLADPKAASYVAKYISKDVAARVRASEHYGESTAYAYSRTGEMAQPGAEGDVKIVPGK